MFSDKLVFIFFGPPGAGKGTQAELISKKFNIPHLSTGDILRNAIEENSDIGKKANTFMHKGELVPDDIVFELVKKRISKADCKNGLLFDGFPRNLNQAKLLLNLKYIQESKLRVILLKLSDEEVIKRLSNRRYCPKCKSVFNLIFKVPKKKSNDSYLCDNCGTKLIIRDDDKIETIKNRLKIYHKTEMMIDYFNQIYSILKIDGTGEQNEIYEKILNAIEGAK